MTIAPDATKAIPIAVPVKGDVISTFGPSRHLLPRSNSVAFGGEAECAGRPARSRWCKSITMKE